MLGIVERLGDDPQVMTLSNIPHQHHLKGVDTET